jgi:uncharacterized protein
VGRSGASLAIFGIAHAYQGWSGVIRTGIFGALYTLAVWGFGSLWPAIALHALVDLGAGVITWVALRGEATSSDVPDAEEHKEAQSV